MLSVTSRPSALHPERKRCTRRRPGASVAWNGVIPPSEKLPSISKVTALSELLKNVVATPAAASPCVHVSRCSIRCPRPFSSEVVTVVSASLPLTSRPVNLKASSDREFRIVCPCPNPPL